LCHVFILLYLLKGDGHRYPPPLAYPDNFLIAD
jgi:hypothetical protein